MQRKFFFDYGMFRLLYSLVGLGPLYSAIKVDDEMVKVGFGWAFRAKFPRSAIAVAKETKEGVLAPGIRVVKGVWVVNTSANGLVEFTLEPRQRAYVMFVPVPLKALRVSPIDCEELLEAVNS